MREATATYSGKPRLSAVPLPAATTHHACSTVDRSWPSPCGCAAAKLCRSLDSTSSVSPLSAMRARAARRCALDSSMALFVTTQEVDARSVS